MGSLSSAAVIAALVTGSRELRSLVSMGTELAVY